MTVNALSNLGQIREYVTWMLEQDEATPTTFWTLDMIDSWIYQEHQYLVSRINEGYEHFFQKVVLADIVKDQQFYDFPIDLKRVTFLEHRTEVGKDIWRTMVPLTDGLEEKPDFHLQLGVSTTDLSRGMGIFFGNRDSNIRYYISAKGFYLIPFFNVSVVSGIRMWYDPYLPVPPDDNWVPFDSLLRDHHEILAVGATIRGKFREEVPPVVTTLYDILWNRLTRSVENRQSQKTKHGPDREGYY